MQCSNKHSTAKPLKIWPSHVLTHTFFRLNSLLIFTFTIVLINEKYVWCQETKRKPGLVPKLKATEQFWQENMKLCSNVGKIYVFLYGISKGKFRLTNVLCRAPCILYIFLWLFFHNPRFFILWEINVQPYLQF